MKWNFVPTVKVGDEVEAGDIIGTVQETECCRTARLWFLMVYQGTIKDIKAGEFTVEETVAVIETENGDKEVSLMQKWPVRKGRPYKKKLTADHAADHWSACCRYVLPDCQRRCGRRTRTVWKRQNGYSASAWQNGRKQISLFISAAASVEMR